MNQDISTYETPMDADPETPRIRQSEFENSEVYSQDAGISEDKPEGIENDDDTPHTPLVVQIPSFGFIQTLPTPMAYTSASPTAVTRSPVDSLHIVKGRRDTGIGRKLDDVANLQQQRVISELPPLSLLSQKRIVSLPTVNEENPSFDVSREQTEPGLPLLTEGLDDDENILIGYSLNDPGYPLKWKIVKEIGNGNFSTVYLYESLDPNQLDLHQVAVKKIKYPSEIVYPAQHDPIQYKDTLSRFESSLTRELSVLRSLDHPCIVKLYGVNNLIFINNKRPLQDLLANNPNLPPCSIITSYCSGGDLLATSMTFAGKLDLWLIQRIFTELTLAVRYLHQNNVIHRDLKLENILLKYPLEDIINMRDSPVFNQKNILELADFGLCKKIEHDEMCTARCGSEDYVSPEILMGVPYDGHLSDTWAIGVILYGLLEDRLPFDPPPNAMTRQRNRSTSHRIARFEWRWFKMAEIESDAKDIVKNTLTRKSSRWKIQQIYDSPYVQQTASSLHF